MKYPDGQDKCWCGCLFVDHAQIPTPLRITYDQCRRHGMHHMETQDVFDQRHMVGPYSPSAFGKEEGIEEKP